MTLLDRYVARIVLGAFGAALLFFLFMAILIDLLNSLPDYARRAAEKEIGGLELALQLAVYYAKLTPVLFTTLTPFVTVIACMFAVARLQNANEVVAMLFVGRSIQRILRPMLLCAAFAGVAMAACWQWVVPHVGAEIVAQEAFLKPEKKLQESLVHEVHGSVDYRLYVGGYDPKTHGMFDVAMLVENPLVSEATLTTAKSAVWDAGKGDWRLTDGALTSKERAAPQEWLERPDVTPDALLKQSREQIDPDTLSYTDLLRLVEARPNRADMRLALHRHITFPLANLLLVMLALPLAVWYERGSRINRLLAAIGLCGGYMVMDLICQRLGSNSLVHPIVAAWSPTIVFGALGVVLFGSTRT
jgi:lipopolysaccharide export system permease protein